MSGKVGVGVWASLGALFLALVIQFSTAVWWASGISEQVAYQGHQIEQVIIEQKESYKGFEHELKVFNERLANILQTDSERLTRIETKMEIDNKNSITVNNTVH